MNHPRSHRLNLAAILLLLLLTPILRAQDLRYLHHQSWSTEDGLPQNSVHQILQSADGFIWIATEGGAARFDGLTFLTFAHANTNAFTSDDTCCLANGSQGDLWIGTSDGLLRLHKHAFIRYDERSGLPSAQILSLLSLPNGTLLVLTTEGVVEWRQSRFQPIPNLPLHIQSLEAAGPDSAWLIAAGRPYLLRNGVATAALGLDGQTDIAQGPQGELWTFSKSTVTLISNGTRRQWTSASGLPGSRIETLFVDRAGTAWVGTNDGLAILTATSPVATPIPALHGNVILEVFDDREGNHWVGSETSGLHLLNSVKFRTEPALAEKALTALAASDGVIWLGTHKDGLLRLRTGSLDIPAAPEALTSPIILSLAPGPQGAVWAGTPDGLNFVAPSGHVRQITSADGLPDDYIQALLADPDGSVWIGTRHGLAHLREANRANATVAHIDVLTRADGLGGDLIGTLLLTSAHTLWVGNSGGLSRLNLNRESNTAPIFTFTTREGLPPGIVTALAEDPSGTLWIATRGGALTRFTDGRFRTLPPPLPDTEIASIVAGGYGFLWLRTTQGIDRVALDDLNRCVDASSPCDPHFSRFTTADGLPSVELASSGSPVLWRMPTGELWSTTRRGVAVTYPEHLPPNSPPPPVALESFLVDDASIPLTDGSIDLSYGHVRFTMEYAALSFGSPSEIHFRYRLEDFDPAWTDAGSRRSATYTNLPPGTYVFRVQAANNDGVWSESGTSLRFRVIPPIYRRWWFLIFVLLALAALAGSLYRLRLRRLQARFDSVLKERNRLAREIHDTLAQDFVGVSIQLDLVAQFLSLSLIEAALEQVHQARKLVTDGLADARQSIWGLRANLAHDSLPTRLAKVIERYSTDALPIRTKIGGAYRKLDPRVETEVLRVVQESLSNVQRHSRATEASIELRYGGDMLVLTVADNGCGFSVEEASARTGHYGLGGMKERAEVIHGALEIVSSPKDGTRIILSAPIPDAQGREAQVEE